MPPQDPLPPPARTGSQPSHTTSLGGSDEERGVLRLVQVCLLECLGLLLIVVPPPQFPQLYTGAPVFRGAESSFQFQALLLSSNLREGMQWLGADP